MHPVPAHRHLAEVIAEAMRFHPSRRLVPVDEYSQAFLRVFARLADGLHSVWAQVSGPDLIFTIRCKTLEASYQLKDSLVYDLSPYYIASMSGLHDDDCRVTYYIRNVGFHLQAGTHWHTRLAFGCELLAA